MTRLPRAIAESAGEQRTGVIHVHSNYSHDGRDTLERLRGFAEAERLSFVGLTDHAEDLTGETFAALTAQCASLSTPQLRLIPGAEFRFAGHPGLHLLAIGLRSWIQPATPEEFCDLVRDNAGLTVVAHPRLCRYRVPEAVSQSVNAVEVWNPQYDTRLAPDPAAIRFFRELLRGNPRLVATFGTDQHDLRVEGGQRVVIQDPIEDPLAAIRQGHFFCRGRRWPKLPAQPDPGRLRLLAFAGLRRGGFGLRRLRMRVGRYWTRWA